MIKGYKEFSYKISIFKRTIDNINAWREIREVSIETDTYDIFENTMYSK